MAFYLVQSGVNLYKVDTSGNALVLALPAGVTINPAKRGRFQILNRKIIFSTSPSVNLLIDANLTISILTPRDPATAPSAAAGGAGVLTGSYRWLITFAIMEGTVVRTESGPSDFSGAVTLAAQSGSLSSIPVSSDPGVNARRVYRTLAGGDLFYFIDTINDNTTTTFSDNATDETAAGSDVLDPDLGGPPGTTTADYIEEMTVWKDRAWALTHNNPDRAYFSGNSVPYAWSPDNFLPIKPIGADLQGGVAFARRRNELGIGRRRSFMKVIGTGDEDSNNIADWDVIGISEEVGIWSPESVVVIRDEAYFQAEDGVYKWGPDGITPLSHDQVRPWFNSDTYFNRALFPNSFANYNKDRDAYQLWLAPVGSTTFNYWVFYDLSQKRWFGPHKTDGLAPVCAGVFEDDNGLTVPVIGAADGKVYKMNRSTFRDGSAAIDMKFIGKRHSQGDPDTIKYWGFLSVFTKPESGGTLTLRARVGNLQAGQGPISVTSLTRVGSTVTVTTATAHGFGDGLDVTIAGATPSAYNGTWTITRVDDTTFTFAITGTPTTPATGTITALDALKADISHDLTKDREKLRQLGVGELCEIEMQQADIDQGCEVYGYEIKPVHVIGRR